ncbi:MAG: dTDP-4-dehydrorhamnose reductase [Deltaproteobacteria bacterium]|nr:dTDP-4-dehydrorhamnose reductase [Deltaproteobacteria bacterium]
MSGAMELGASRILLTGARGMLARDLVPVLNRHAYVLQLSDLRGPCSCSSEILALDITKSKEVLDVVEDFRPNWIVNCAAFTNVDGAEDCSEVAHAINGIAVGNLASAANAVGAAVLQISTDYVFSGNDAAGVRKIGFDEAVLPRPIGVYAQSKYVGELLVRRLLPNNHLIVRTSWLHGVHGANFVDTMLRVGRGREELKVVDDQIGSPTWTAWLAYVLERLISKEARGMFHVASRGNISWLDFAKEIFSLANSLEVNGSDKYAVRVVPQSTAELARKAPRPAFSTLDVRKVEEFLQQECISWKEGLKQHLLAIRAMRQEKKQ